MDPLLLTLTIVLSILAIVLTIVGLQIILVLQEFKNTLKRVNMAADTVEKVVLKSVGPLANMGGIIDGVRGGLKIMHAFASWLGKDK